MNDSKVSFLSNPQPEILEMDNALTSGEISSSSYEEETDLTPL
jgi:hypothetical protein